MTANTPVGGEASAILAEACSMTAGANRSTTLRVGLASAVLQVHESERECANLRAAASGAARGINPLQALLESLAMRAGDGNCFGRKRRKEHVTYRQLKRRWLIWPKV